jgi:beta-lactamase superfamily II metal-dependent hydrolase
MQIYTLAVGQGHMTVITHGREAIIVDTHIPGPNEERVVFVKAALAKILDGRKLAGLLLTSFDADHADPRGVAWIVGKYWPQWVLYPKYYKDTGIATDVFTTIRDIERQRSGTRRELERIPVRLDQMEGRHLTGLSQELSIELFSPHIENMSCSNNCSIVARVAPTNETQGFSYLITGDTENDRWAAINRIFGKRLRADVMEAPHHGSHNGINAETMKRIDPAIVLVSAGFRNQYGHPHKEAVQLLSSTGAQVYSTHTGNSLRTFRGWSGLTTETWRA